MSDLETLALRRAAAVGPDALDAARLEAAARRIETPAEKVTRELAEDEIARARLATGIGPRRAQDQLEKAARDAYLRALGAKRLPSGGKAIVEGIAARAFEAAIPAWAPLVAADEERLRESLIRRDASEAARRAALRLESVRAFGTIDLREALDRAQGTATKRTLSVSDLWATITHAIGNGRATFSADASVPKSYRYPVTFTRVEAIRDANEIILVIERTQTWGSDEGRREIVLISADLAVGREG